MKIEHLALNVEDPVAMAKWYAQNLGFTIIKEMNTPPFAHFIADAAKNMLLEIFRLPDKQLPDYKSLDPAIMHLGFVMEDLEADYRKLVSANAIIVDEISKTANGDQVVMLRDPWGLPIQLIKRVKPMI